MMRLESNFFEIVVVLVVFVFAVVVVVDVDSIFVAVHYVNDVVQITL